MTDLDKKEIKGINLPIIRWFVAGTITVCTTVIGTGMWVVNSIKENTRDIAVLKQDVLLHTREIVDLRVSDARQDAYFDKPKEIVIKRKNPIH